MLKQLYLLFFVLLMSHFSAMAQAPCEPKPPVAICDEVVVLTLDDKDTAKLLAASIDDGSFAYTCASDDIALSIARVDLCDGDCVEDNFSPSVDFTTDDVFESFNVILKATDKLGKSNQCWTIVKVLDKSDHGDDNNPLGDDPNGCTLACLDNITASLSSNGTANIWTVDFLESICSGKLLLKVQDADQNVIFEQTTESHWTATADDVDKPYTYLITHEATGNVCWGNVLIVDKIGDNGTETETDGDPDAEDATCPDFAIDFSSYSIETELEFKAISLAAVNSQLSSTYAIAFNDMIRANGLDPSSNGYIVAYNIHDDIFKFDNGDLKVVRTITLLDWCNFDPSNGNNGVKEVTQVIKISGLSSMIVADINYAESSKSISVNEIFLKNENGQVAMPAISTNESLSTTISNTLQTAKWEQGKYEIEVDKYDVCGNGVSSIDIVLVLRHILGLKVLDSNAKVVAADFDENGSVSAGDLVSMRKTVLGLENCNNDSKWRFYKKGLNESNSFDLTQLPNHKLSYTIDQSEPGDINIVALKKGDVNLSAVDKKTTKSKKTQISTSDIDLKAGNEYEVKFIATEDLDFVSGDFDFELNTDFEITGFSSDALDIEDYHYHIGDSKAKLIWYGEENASIEKDAQVLTMHIRSNINGKLSNILTPSMTDLEIYPSIDSKKSVRSQISFLQEQGKAFDTASNFNIYMDNHQLSISYNDNTGTLIKAVEVFNMTGQRVYANMNVDQKELVTPLRNNNAEILTYRVISDSGQIQVGKVFTY